MNKMAATLDNGTETNTDHRPKQEPTHKAPPNKGADTSVTTVSDQTTELNNL